MAEHILRLRIKLDEIRPRFIKAWIYEDNWLCNRFGLHASSLGSYITEETLKNSFVQQSHVLLKSFNYKVMLNNNWYELKIHLIFRVMFLTCER